MGIASLHPSHGLSLRKVKLNPPFTMLAENVASLNARS
jgi:hypothetical protein